MNFNQYCKKYFKQHGEKFEEKYTGPKFDAHTHVWDLKQTQKCISYSHEFGIQKILAIVDEHLKLKMDQDFPNVFHYARFIRTPTLFKGESEKVFQMVEKFKKQGYSMIKFWFAPRWRDYAKERYGIEVNISGLADPILTPFFSALEKNNMRLLLHTSDPDSWYLLKYQPESYYGTKEQHLRDLEQILRAHPNLTIQGAHLAAQPERLENLSQWLDKYPNFVADMSSARWMARELSKEPEKSRKFLNRHSHKLFFGSDLSYGRRTPDQNQEYFYTRYLTYFALLETDVVEMPLPFPDPENNNETVINGLNLSNQLLEKLYWENAVKFYEMR